MFRALLPYCILAFAITATAGIGYGQGFVGVGGSYAALTLAILVMAVGYTRWERREYEKSSRGR